MVDPPLFLAPMAGVTDRDFRLIVRRIGGIGVVSMEFISSKLLLAGDRRTRKMMAFVPEERPLAVQIYGSDPAILAEAARIVDGLGVDLLRHQHGMPGEQGAGRLLGRRPDGRPGAGRAHRARGACRNNSAADRQIPARARRETQKFSRDRPHLPGGRGRGGDPARPHRPPDVRGPRRLVLHRRAEGGPRHSGDRQRRHPRGGRRARALPGRPAATA